MAYKRNVEIFEEAYEKKDAKSVVSYVARDGRRRYIAGNKNPDGGGNMPSGGGMTEVTWQELKDKRDNGELNPGSLYRITDYVTTTSQENTRSAGHQFDIVLLALSEDKLAEEGWAMMHPTDVYDVVCTDGVIIKCYYYTYYGEFAEELVNLVSVDTLLGNVGHPGDYEGIINHETKTITAPIDSTTFLSALDTPDLPYSYFQNSNLSAWKVWYCLDNDTDRFAWADDGSPSIYNEEFGYWFVRDASKDVLNKYAWYNTADDSTVLTDNLEPKIGDICYSVDGILEAGTVSNLRGFGHGVIYRLIDEFNNDCPYDFKNIQYKTKLDSDGYYYSNLGADSWVYTFNVFQDGVCDDATIVGNKLKNDEGAVSGVFSNKIESEISNNSTPSLLFGLNNCIVLTCVTSDGYFGFNQNLLKSCDDLKLNANFVCSCIFLGCSSKLIVDDAEQSIYINNKKVLTEE